MNEGAKAFEEKPNGESEPGTPITIPMRNMMTGDVVHVASVPGLTLTQFMTELRGKGFVPLTVEEHDTLRPASAPGELIEGTFSVVKKEGDDEERKAA